MSFNTIDFAIFLPIVFLLYWFVANKSIRLQNILIIVASYVFYGWWDWRFLSLIIISTIVDFIVGLGLSKEKNQTKRKLLLLVSIIINLGILGFFKYYNFFIDNFTLAFSIFGAEIKAESLNIILPVGISFYTFQTLSYSIDVYRRKLEPTTDIFAFSAFVSFFPQLVAGPIERAKRFLPQFYNPRSFDYDKGVDGMRQILWGLFKKAVIADSCAEYANLIFNNSADFSGSTLVVGAVFFAFQIYCDFSGYSDIAIGTARLFGFDLMRNFAFPYFSRDMAEFWRRWHISLSSWFKEYLYIPLGGSRGSIYQKARNVFIIFILCGLWHGANWTYLAWGALNALYVIPLIITSKNRKHLDIVASGKVLPSLKDFLLIILTFSLTILSWIFFRAENIEHAINYISKIFSLSLFSIPEIRPKSLVVMLFLFVLTEWHGRSDEYAFQKFTIKWPRILRISLYCAILYLIFFYTRHEEEFIYFRF